MVRPFFFLFSFLRFWALVRHVYARSSACAGRSGCFSFSTRRAFLLKSSKPSRLPVDLIGEDFAKAVDDLLKEIHDIDEAQRRLRIIAEGTLPKPDNNRKP